MDVVAIVHQGLGRCIYYLVTAFESLCASTIFDDDLQGLMAGC